MKYIEFYYKNPLKCEGHAQKHTRVPKAAEISVPLISVPAKISSVSYCARFLHLPSCVKHVSNQQHICISTGLVLSRPLKNISAPAKTRMFQM